MTLLRLCTRSSSQIRIKHWWRWWRDNRNSEESLISIIISISCLNTRSLIMNTPWKLDKHNLLLNHSFSIQMIAFWMLRKTEKFKCNKNNFLHLMLQNHQYIMIFMETKLNPIVQLFNKYLGLKRRKRHIWKGKCNSRF